MFNSAIQNSFRAALMMTAASCFIGMTAILAKTLGQGFNGESLHPLQVSAGRFGFALLTILIFLLIKQNKFEKPHYIIHFTRSVFGWIGVTCMFAAVTLIAVPDAISISFLNPVFAMFLALLILKERVGALRWSAAGIALVGSFILLRPGFDGFQLGAVIAFIAALCFIFLGWTSLYIWPFGLFSIYLLIFNLRPNPEKLNYFRTYGRRYKWMWCLSILLWWFFIITGGIWKWDKSMMILSGMVGALILLGMLGISTLI